MGNEKFDVIIAGAGSMGMAAGYFLSKNGAKTLMIDSFDPPHSNGSHHGETRIIRHAYGEGREYVPLTLRSQQLWNELQAESGKELFINSGIISFGKENSSFISEVIESSKEFHLPLSILSWKEIRAKWPGLRIPENFIGCLEETSGILRVEECIQAYKELAIQNGAAYLPNTKVTAIESTGYDVAVKTKSQIFHADKVIVSSGAWTTKLLSDINLPIEPIRKTVAWFDAEKGCYDIGSFPGFIFDLEDSMYYGFPNLGGGLKVGRHDTGEKINPDELDRNFSTYHSDEIDLTNFVQTYFPNADHKPSNGQVCIYSMTPDENFIIDFHPNQANIVLAGGFSGHGFKFSSVVGEILCELVTKGKSSHDISAFSLSRFDNA